MMCFGKWRLVASMVLCGVDAVGPLLLVVVMVLGRTGGRLVAFSCSERRDVIRLVGFR